MATFVRDHGTTEAAASGTTVTRNLAADVPAGRTLLAVAFSAGDPDSGLSSISKPIGETATWNEVGSIGWTYSSGDDRGYLKVWAIKTTTTWFAGQGITVTTLASSAARTIEVSEWIGLKAERLGDAATASKNGGFSSGTSLTVTLPEPVQTGDVVIAAGSSGAGSVSVLHTIASEGGTADVAPPSVDMSTRPGYQFFGLARARVVVAAGSRTATFTTSNNGSPVTFLPAGALLLALPADDYAPYAPTITSMTGGVVLDRNRTNRLTWTFSSPNAVDNQSKYDVRYRPEGDTTWTTVTAVTTNSFRDFAAATFAAGDWEIQVRVYGALGKDSPWSPSAYFTMADPPAGAVITYPIDGQSVDQLERIDWSIPAQDAYQFRRVADDGTGSPVVDPTGDDVYYDSGEVTDTTTRSLPITFAVNGRTEHLQIQVKDDGLWQTEWDSVRVDVSYTPPPTPSRVLYADPDTASILVEITNPEPEGDDPAAVNNEIWIDDGNGWERRAAGLPLNGVWRYWLPRSGRDYTSSIRVVAVAANGTTASST